MPINSNLAIHGGKATRKTPLKPAWPRFLDEEEKQIQDVLRITREGMGKPIGKTSEFEKKFAEYHQAKGAVVCANCSLALEIMLAVSGVKPGDEVIVPPFTYIATAGAVVAVGAVPIFADIDPETCQIDPQSIKEKITNKTKAIIPVHFSGQFAEMEKIMEIANSHKLIVLEDAAQAHGGVYKNEFAGFYGKAAAFSFQYGKNMTAQEGGVIISNDEAFLEACWEYIWYGRRKGEPWYKHYQVSSNYRLTEFQSALLLGQLSRLKEETELRQKNANLLDKLLSDIEGVLLFKPTASMNIHPRHLYLIRLSKELMSRIKEKKVFVDAVNAEGIPLYFGYEYPLYKTPAFLEKNFRVKGWYEDIYNEYDYKSLYLPAAEDACTEVVWLLHTVFLGSEQDIQDIYSAIKKVTNFYLNN